MNLQLQQAIEHLNPRQREAVNIVQGPLLVVAGAGSGKTKTLTVRIANLVENHEVPPHAILAVTFTNKAAGQMKERVIDLIPRSAGEVTLTTFHSFCCQLLRRWSPRIGFSNGFTIYDDDDQERLMKKILNDLEIDQKQFSPKFMLNLISQAKNDLLSPAEFLPPHRHAEKIKEVYATYQKRLMDNAAVDFDDLIFQTYFLLERNPDLLEKVQNRYQYMLVDEYQDTNFAQYRLTALLSKASGNLCVVGDDDQSIYGWRGATIRNILEFEKDFPGARVVILDQNYRSTQIILDAASSVIANNSGKRKKRLWTERSGGDPLVFKYLGDGREEADFLAREIQSLQRKGFKLSDLAVLFRMNSLTREPEQALVHYQIPYEITGGVKFFQRREVKDILAYLKVLSNDRDSIALKRIINTPRRGIGDATVEKLEKNGALWDEVAGAAKKSPSSKIGVFHALMTTLREVSAEESPLELTKRIIEETEYFDYLEETDPETATDRKENIQGLLADIRSQEDANPGLKLKEYLEKVALHADVDDLDESADKVHFLTLHNAKGLEFPVVFMMGMEEGIFPHHSSKDLPHELEEERRLAYVGMTRAMKHLYFTAAKRRLVFGTWAGNPVSRFIAEVPRELFGERGVKQEPKKFHFAAEKSGSEGPVESGVSGKTEKVFSSFGGSTRSLPKGVSFGSQRKHFSSDDIGKGVPGTLLNLKPGVTVYHQAFGLGRVVSTEGGNLGDFRVSVEFKEVGKKNFLLQYTNLRVINTQNNQEVKSW